MKTPKHQKISESLRAQIEAGKYSEGKRLPSEAELARRFKVSRPTAARALLQLRQSNLIERRVGSGTYLRSVKKEVVQKAGVLGLLVSGLGNTEILDPICNELTRFGQSNGFEVLWGDASNPVASAEDAEQLCKQYIDRKVSGVFFAPLEAISDREKLNLRLATTLEAAGISVVLLDRDLCEFPGRSKYDLVGIDNFHAGMLLAGHLLSLGHRRFVFLARHNFPSTTDLRLAGCREAISRAGASQPEVRIGEPDDVDFVQGILQPELPDVVICSNDRNAALLIQTLGGLGIQVAKDLNVVGFDDVRYATLLAVPLTTVRQPCREIGQAAIRTMKERLLEPTLPPRQILLPVELVVRRSCGVSRRGSEGHG